MYPSPSPPRFKKTFRTAALAVVASTRLRNHSYSLPNEKSLLTELLEQEGRDYRPTVERSLPEMSDAMRTVMLSFDMESTPQTTTTATTTTTSPLLPQLPNSSSKKNPPLSRSNNLNSSKDYRVLKPNTIPQSLSPSLSVARENPSMNAIHEIDDEDISTEFDSSIIDSFSNSTALSERRRTVRSESFELDRFLLPDKQCFVTKQTERLLKRSNVLGNRLNNVKLERAKSQDIISRRNGSEHTRRQSLF